MYGIGYVALMQAIINQAERDALRKPTKKKSDTVNKDDAINFLQSDYCETMQDVINDILNPVSKTFHQAKKLC